MKRLWLLAVLAACGHQRPQQTVGDASAGAPDSGLGGDSGLLGGDSGLGSDGGLDGGGHDVVNRIELCLVAQ